MSNDLMASIKNQLATMEVGLDEDTKAVAGNASRRRISIEGGVFRKYVNGKEVGTVEDRHMNVIFVRMAHTPARTFYDGAYKRGVKVSPACWSSDSKVPDAEVPNPPASKCEACPKSIKGSSHDGQGAACRLSWRTAVVLGNDPGGDVMQLVLPAASVFGKEENGRWPFRAYVQYLAANNISAKRVVTKMQFDTNSSSPKLLFSPVAPVDLPGVIDEQSNSPAAIDAVKMTVYKMDKEDESQAPTPTAAAPEAEVIAEPTVRAKPSAAKGAASAEDLVARWAGAK